MVVDVLGELCAPFVRRWVAKGGGVCQNGGETRRRNGLNMRDTLTRVRLRQSSGGRGHRFVSPIRTDTTSATGWIR